jgi:hypothetical protein
MAGAVTLKKVGVKRSVYTKIINPGKLVQYLIYCKAFGTKYILFKDPNITNAFYQLSTDAAKAITDAVATHTKAPTKGNLKAIFNKMARAVLWLDAYADEVEVISNDDANRSTRSEAANNIMQSYLEPKKLVASRAGKPSKPELKGKMTGMETADVRITNAKMYSPRKTNFVAIASSCKAIVTIKNKMLDIVLTNPGHIVFQSLDGKGRYTRFNGLTSIGGYDIYAYGQNGKKQLSKLSSKLKI